MMSERFREARQRYLDAVRMVFSVPVGDLHGRRERERSVQRLEAKLRAEAVRERRDADEVVREVNREAARAAGLLR